jgi:hypothetical protein
MGIVRSRMRSTVENGKSLRGLFTDAIKKKRGISGLKIN